MYQYILFDLDGTLTDPKEGITKSVQYALADQGIIEEDLLKLEPFIGPPLLDSFMEFYQMNEEDAHKAIAKYRERFQKTGLYENEIYPGISQMLQSLQHDGRRLAVASSKPTVFVEKILRHFHIKQYFDVIVGSELDGTRSKKEEVVEEALKQLFEDKTPDPETVVMVGDRKFDVEGARAFSIPSIGVEYGYAGAGELQEAGATHIVKSVRELSNLLLNRGKKSGKTKRDATVERQQPAYMKLWNLVFPVVLYYLTSSLFIFVGLALVQAIVSTQSVEVIEWWVVHATQVRITVNGIGMIVGFLFIRKFFLEDVFWMEEKITIKTGKVFHLWIREEVHGQKGKWQRFVPVLLLAITSSIFFNQLFAMLKINESSETYTEVAASQYSVPIWLGLILYGIISPIAEEAVFRGILYHRLKRYFALVPAVIVQALLFGAYHGNLVQGIYGTVMALLIVLCYECYKSFLFPVAFHAAANITVFLLSKNQLFSSMQNGWINCVIFAIISCFCGFFIWKSKEN